MKVAVTATGNDLESTLDSRFGRCRYLLFVDTENMEYEALANPYAEEAGGVGPRLASLMAERGATLLLTGALGPNAQRALDAADIRTLVDCQGTIREAIEHLAAEAAPAEQAATPTASQTQPRQPRRCGGCGLGRQHRQRGHARGRDQKH